MQVIAIKLTDADHRYFRVEDGYSYSHYHEVDQAPPHNRALILVLSRTALAVVPPSGRLDPAQLQALAEANSAAPMREVLARYPYWMEIEHSGQPFEMPDDTDCEPVQLLPPSVVTPLGMRVLPAKAYEALHKPKAAEAVAEKPAKGKEG